MFNKIKAVPVKKSFFIGFALILITPLLSLLIVDLFLMPNWIMISVGVFINFFSILFI